MEIVRDEAGLAPFRGGVFVPTMGALHAGHEALLSLAFDLAGVIGASGGASGGGDVAVVASIFVNPAQFEEPRDFENYPRDLDADAGACERLGVDCLFVPPVEVVYAPGLAERPFELPPVATEPGLEDRARPGHFAGVYRVCRRLFEMTRPAIAVFGEKDWQQLLLMTELVRAERLDVEIAPCPTVREADGLAMASRNRRLLPGERERAGAMPRALEGAGTTDDPVAAERAGRRVLEEAGLEVEYLAVRDEETLRDVRPGRPARVLAAARLGETRLIDNAPWPGARLRG